MSQILWVSTVFFVSGVVWGVGAHTLWIEHQQSKAKRFLVQWLGQSAIAPTDQTFLRELNRAPDDCF